MTKTRIWIHPVKPDSQYSQKKQFLLMEQFIKPLDKSIFKIYK